MNILGTELVKILRMQYNQTKWSVILGISKQLINQWKVGTKPRAETLRHIKNVLLEVGNYKAYNSFEKLAKRDLYEITPHYMKFRARNLFEYMASERLEKLNIVIQHNYLPSNEKENYYNQLIAIIQSLNNLDVDKRKNALNQFQLVLKNDSILTCHSNLAYSNRLINTRIPDNYKLEDYVAIGLKNVNKLSSESQTENSIVSFYKSQSVENETHSTSSKK